MTIRNVMTVLYHTGRGNPVVIGSIPIIPYHTVTDHPYSTAAILTPSSPSPALSLSLSLSLSFLPSLFPLPHYSLSPSLYYSSLTHFSLPHTNSLPYKVLLHIRFGEFPNKHSLIVATPPFFLFISLFSLASSLFCNHHDWFWLLSFCLLPHGSALCWSRLGDSESPPLLPNCLQFLLQMKNSYSRDPVASVSSVIFALRALLGPAPGGRSCLDARALPASTQTRTLLLRLSLSLPLPFLPRPVLS